jgi:hypothetical protein
MALTFPNRSRSYDEKTLFKRACWMNKIQRGSEEANSIAQRLMWAYRAGRQRQGLPDAGCSVRSNVGKESQKHSVAANEQSPGQQTAA